MSAITIDGTVVGDVYVIQNSIDGVQATATLAVVQAFDAAGPHMSPDVVQLVAHSQYAWHLNETTKKQAELRLLVYGNLVLEPAEGSLPQLETRRLGVSLDEGAFIQVPRGGLPLQRLLVGLGVCCGVPVVCSPHGHEEQPDGVRNSGDVDSAHYPNSARRRGRSRSLRSSSR